VAEVVLATGVLLLGVRADVACLSGSGTLRRTNVGAELLADEVWADAGRGDGVWFAGARLDGGREMVVRVAVRLDTKARTGVAVACGGHRMGGGSLGMVRLRAEEGTAMDAYLRRTKVRRQEHSFDEHLYPLFLGSSSREVLAGHFWRLPKIFEKSFEKSFGDPVFCHTPSVS
jgi:hypothetical protein